MFGAEPEYILVLEIELLVLDVSARCWCCCAEEDVWVYSLRRWSLQHVFRMMKFRSWQNFINLSPFSFEGKRSLRSLLPFQFLYTYLS